MPISLPNFLQAETRSYGPGDLLGGLMQGYQASRMPAQMRNEELRQQLANRLLQEQGTNYQITNQYLPQKMQTDIDHIVAQTGLSRQQAEELVIKNAIERATGMERAKASLGLTQAQTGHFGALTNALNIRSPLEAQQLQELIKGVQYQNMEAQRQEMFARQFFDPSLNQGIPGSENTNRAMNAEANTPFPSRVGMEQQRAPVDTGDVFNDLWLNPLTRARAEKFGIKGKIESKTIPETGEIITLTTLPDGRVIPSVQQVGKSLYQRELDKGFAQSDVKAAEEISNAAKVYTGTEEAANKVLDALTSNEKLSREITGPGKQQWAKYFGPKKAKEIIGKVEKAQGDILTAALGSFKGATHVKEINVIERMKGSLNDTYDVLKAKTQAIADTSKLLKERNKIAVKNIRHHKMPEIDAWEDAIAKTPFDSIESEINKATAKNQDLAGATFE